jgi:hypothetical protein
MGCETKLGAAATGILVGKLKMRSVAGQSLEVGCGVPGKSLSLRGKSRTDGSGFSLLRLELLPHHRASLDTNPAKSDAPAKKPFEEYPAVG